MRTENNMIERQFVTFVSHQLQSPLAAVQQYLDVLNHLEDSPRKEELQKEWINRSMTKIDELLGLIRDWLNLSKIESGTFVDKTESVNLVPIISHLLQTYENIAKQGNITLSLNALEKIQNIIGNEKCLKELFSNLIVNAIKYNKQNGKVTISAEEDSNYVTVSISDTGFGIPEENLDSIFEEFNRGKHELTKNIKGTGLGLPICKRIINELGGRIDVQSKLNEGSVFRVSLPKYREMPSA